MNQIKTKTSKAAELAAVSIMIAMGALPMAHANGEGGLQGGGGDTKTEARIDEIRSDILTWINDGGAQEMKFENGVTYQLYVPAMNAVLAKQAVVISAIATQQENAEDEELNTSVAGQPKTCKGFISKKDFLPHILCNVERFATTSESDQYRLIHHEYAGLALMEKNVGAASDYALSNQITDSLASITVLKLVVKKKNGFPHSKDSILITNKTYPDQSLLIQCVGADCQDVDVTLNQSSVKKRISLQGIQEELNRKISARDICKENHPVTAGCFSPYSITQFFIKGRIFPLAGAYGKLNDGLIESWKKGYEAVAVLRVLALAIMTPLDTALLPFSTIASATDSAEYKNNHLLKWKKKFLRRVENGEDLQMKDRQFSKYRKVLGI